MKGDGLMPADVSLFQEGAKIWKGGREDRENVTEKGRKGNEKGKIEE